MAHSVRRHLRLEVAAYDAAIRRFIPAYEEMLRQAAAAVAAVRPERVLDVGAGTGALSEALLRHPEVGNVELLDVDAEMLQQARGRLGGHPDRVRFTVRSFDEPFPPCDAIAAALSLHHIPTLEAKAALFARAFNALPPGGLLVNADATMPADPPERERLFRYWADHMVACGIEEQRAWQHFDEWSGEDTYLPLEAELDAMSRAGFEACCTWRAGPIGVVVATRPVHPARAS
jgi:tRNA (cmo5U34)-methyltransferase